MTVKLFHLRGVRSNRCGRQHVKNVHCFQYNYCSSLFALISPAFLAFKKVWLYRVAFRISDRHHFVASQKKYIRDIAMVLSPKHIDSVCAFSPLASSTSSPPHSSHMGWNRCVPRLMLDQLLNLGAYCDTTNTNTNVYIYIYT